MKLVHSSAIHFGRSFTDPGLPGDKLRAGIKSIFSGIIDTANQESADLLILAGDTFDNLRVSQNLLDFFVSEVKRLDKTRVIVIPGSRDQYEKGSFWEQWKIFRPAENLHVLADPDKPHVEIPEISTVVYACSPGMTDKPGDRLERLKIIEGSDFHIAVLYGRLISDPDQGQDKYSLSYDKLAAIPFDYAALGGQPGFRNFVDLGLRAAYAGSPAALSATWKDAGNILLVDLQKGSLNVEPRKLDGFEWKEIDISMDTIANMEDLKSRIIEMAGPNTSLKVNLSGLALLEAGLNLDHLRNEIEDQFLHLEFVDRTQVLPDNISEVKVQEKTILGQYLKLMVDKLNSASGAQKRDLEESLKIGYTLLSGREIW
jgi:DNA repair exonuclease SbcCD nuclease subunit